MAINGFVNEKYDIILLAGQSNAEGNGLGEGFPWEEDKRIYRMRGEYKAEAVKTAYGNDYLSLEIFDDYKIEKLDKKRFCLAVPFAIEYANKYLEQGRKVLILQASVGGTGFAKNHWGEGDILFNRMIKMCEEALSLNAENRLVAFLWHQGEHDAFENADWDNQTRNQTHIRNLENMLDLVRGRFGELPFVCAGFTKPWTEEYPAQNEAILSAMEWVCKQKQNAKFIKETKDLLTNDDEVANGDRVHFSKKSLWILGERYFAAYQDMITKKGEIK